MNGLQELLSTGLAYRLGWTLVHSLWQGAVVAGLFVLALLIVPKSRPNIRYLAGLLSLVFMVLLCAATFVAIDPPRSLAVAEGLESIDGPVAFAIASVEPVSVESEMQSEVAHISQVEPIVDAVPAEPWPERAMKAAQVTLTPALPWIAGAWLIGVMLLSVWRCGGMVATYRLRRVATSAVPDHLRELVVHLAERLQVSRPVQVLQSAVIATPAVIGHIRPVILLPVAAITGLSPRELEAIIAHELAHIRRYDYLVNILQTVAETLLFHHPSVWWISRRIRAERENCCDDVALAMCGDRLTYARALAQVEQLGTGDYGLAAAASGGSLLGRIQRIADVSVPGRRPWGGWTSGVVTIVLVLAVALGVRMNAVGASDHSLPNSSTPEDKGNITPPEMVAVPVKDQASVTRIFPLKHVESAEMVEVLARIFSGLDPLSVRQDKFINSVVVPAAEADLNHIAYLIAQLDRPSPRFSLPADHDERVVRVIILEYVKPQNAAETINSLYQHPRPHDFADIITAQSGSDGSVVLSYSPSREPEVLALLKLLDSPSRSDTFVRALRVNAADRVFEQKFRAMAGEAGIECRIMRYRDRFMVQADARSIEKAVELLERIRPATPTTMDGADAGQSSGPAISGLIRLPDGMPAAGAQVALATGPDLLPVCNTRLERDSYDFISETGPSGRYSFPSQEKPFAIVVIHDAGWRLLASEDLPASGDIHLQAWARLEGMVTVGGKPAAGQEIMIDHGLLPGPTFVYDRTLTDEHGRFSFWRIPPGDGWLALGQKGKKSHFHVEPSQTLTVKCDGEAVAIEDPQGEASKIEDAGPRATTAALRRLRPGDRLRFRALDFVEWGAQSDLSQTIDEHGQIYLPAIGKLKAAGLTASALRDRIIESAKAKDIYKAAEHPDVFVELSEQARPRVTHSRPATAPAEQESNAGERSTESRVCYIAGEVARPGAYALGTDAPVTLLQVVEQAGGIDRSASSGAIGEISRRPLRGKPMVRTCDLSAIAAGQAEDVVVEPNDYIRVAYRDGKPATDWREERLRSVDAARQADPNEAIMEAFAPAGSGLYYMAGLIKRPGPYRLTTEVLTLRRAMLAAGGVETKKPPEPLTCRIGRRQHDGTQEVIVIDDIDAVLAGEQPDIEIRPNDVIRIEPSGGLKPSASEDRAPVQMQVP